MEWNLDVIIQDKLCSESSERSESITEQRKMLDEICCSSTPLNDDNSDKYLS